MLFAAFLEKINKDEVLILFATEDSNFIEQDVIFSVAHRLDGRDFSQDPCFEYYQSKGFNKLFGVIFNINALKQYNKIMQFLYAGTTYNIHFTPETNTAFLISARSLVKDKLYLYPMSALYFCDKKSFYRKALLKREFYIALWSKISPRRIAYTDFMNPKVNNTYKLFKDVPEKYKDKSFYITKKPEESNEVETLSSQHFAMLARTKKVVTSWHLLDIFMPNVWVDHYRYIYPLLTFKWFYVPHSVSFDKTSLHLSKYCFGAPSYTLTCSEHEKAYFEEMGYKNITITGCPRMDQWKALESNKINNTIMLFLLNNDKIKTKTALLTSQYFQNLTEIVVRQQDKKIYFVWHRAIPMPVRNLMEQRLRQLHHHMVFIHEEDQEQFIHAFTSAEVLITDTSSMAYDFAYMDKKSIFFIEPAQKTNYQFRPQFWEHHVGYIVSDIDSLLETIDNTEDHDYIIARKKNFFTYDDDDNTKRVMEQIL